MSVMRSRTFLAWVEDRIQLQAARTFREPGIYEWRRNQGFQLIHSKQAVASGGLTGYGFARGPYIQDDFFSLPEKHNDFIFATVEFPAGTPPPSRGRRTARPGPSSATGSP